jgi:Leucine-rich repeat (LRR) protein
MNSLGASCKQLNNICSGSIGIWSLFFAKSRKYIPISRIVALANHRHIEYLDMSRVVVVEDQPLSSPGGLAADGESGNNENDVEHENNDEADENDNENDDDEEAELAQQVAAKVGLGLSARGGTYLAVRSASLFKKVKVLVFRHQHLGDHAAVKLLVDAMSDLEYLDISSPMSGVNSAMMTELAKLPNLCTLKARRTAFSNGALSVLTDFKSLIVLDVCGSDAVSDSVIGKIISSMTNLEQLCLSECPVTDVCCPIIAAKLPNLIALRFAYTYATQQGIGEFSKLKNLELLDIRGSNIAEFAMQELCDRLEELHSLRDLMWDHKHTQNTLSRLASLNFLRNVSIKNVDNEGLMLIRNFPRLRTLSISEYLGDDSSMMSMSEMTDMEELSITVAPFIGFSGLSELRNMVRCFSVAEQESALT